MRCSTPSAIVRCKHRIGSPTRSFVTACWTASRSASPRSASASAWSAPRRHRSLRALPDCPRPRHVGLDRTERRPRGQVRARHGRRDRGRQRGLRREDQQPDRSIGYSEEGRAPLCTAGRVGWTLDESLARKEKGQARDAGKDGRPSEANHGNVTPSLSDRDRETGEYLAGGVTISHAEQTVVLSLPRCVGCAFPWTASRQRTRRCGPHRAGGTGLCAAALAAESGLDLRSRCLLWPVEPLTWELLGKPGETPTSLCCSCATQAIRLLNEAVKNAKALGLPGARSPSRSRRRTRSSSSSSRARTGGSTGRRVRRRR